MQLLLLRQYNLNDLLSRLYMLYGNYFQELGLTKSARQKEYLDGAAKMYTKASEIVKITKNNCVHIEIQRSKGCVKVFLPFE